MFPGNKRKAITFSFDDGVTQDRRLVKLFNKYNLKCTWNLNSLSLDLPGICSYRGHTVTHDKVSVYEVKDLYKGHEVAVHTTYHPHLINESDEGVIHNIEDDRMFLEKLCGYPIIGMAYPFGEYDDRVIKLMKEKTKIKYSRTVWATYSFSKQSDSLLAFRPTVHALDFDKINDLIDEFLLAKPNQDMVFYIWGHSYEFDYENTWEKFEEILKKLSNKDDIFYGTNKEVLLDSNDD